MKPFARTARFSVLTVTLLFAAFAHAQNYPAKSVRMIVPFPPGGISDTLARVTAQQLSDYLPQQFVVDNRPGAGTTLAADVVAKSPPDGHTLYFTDVTTHAINASLYSKLPFDPVKDFTGISKLNAEVGNMLKQPKVQEQWARYGASPVSMSPAQVTDHVRSEISKFAVVVKASGARID